MKIMIKTTYLFPAFLLMLAGCATEDVESEDNRETGGTIEFKVALNDAGTRATEVTTNTINEIQVSASKADTPTEIYFQDKIFSKNPTTGKFASKEAECVWPNKTSVLQFNAFSPSIYEMKNAGGWATSTGNKLT